MNGRESMSEGTVTMAWSVATPAMQQALLIPKPEWARLRRRVGEAQRPIAWFQNSGWGLVGAGVSLLGVAVTLPPEASVVRRAVVISSTVVALLVGAISFAMASLRKKDEALDLTHINEDMKHLEEMYPARVTPPQTAPSVPFELLPPPALVDANAEKPSAIVHNADSEQSDA